MGLSGWLIARSVTISSFETEDYVLLSGITTGGVVLDEEVCRRLFSLNASTQDFHTLPEQTLSHLVNMLDAQKIGILGL